MSNTRWTDAEMQIIAAGAAGALTVEQVMDRLPHRSVRGIRKKLARANRAAVHPREEIDPTPLSPDDDGEDDGWEAQHRISAELGSRALGRAVARYLEKAL